MKAQRFAGLLLGIAAFAFPVIAAAAGKPSPLPDAAREGKWDVVR